MIAHSASAGVLVDSNWNVFSPNYSAYASASGGSSLVQSISVNGTYSIDSLSIYGSGSGAKLYITADIGGDTSRNDVLWTGLLDNTTMGWQSFSGSGLVLGPGEYFLVLESDTPQTSAARWARATASGRYNLGEFGIADFQPGGFAPGNEFTMVSGYSLTTRIFGQEYSVPAPGAVALAGLGGLLAARRRRG